MFWNLGAVIMEPQKGALPIQWGALGFERVIVEIGFGNGEHLEFLSSQFPNDLIVGIEVSQWCLLKAARRVLQKNIKNVRLIHGDARYLLQRCFLPSSIDLVIMNFPCPWPKKKHVHHRVSSPAFATLMARMLKVDGAFQLATDVDWYAEQTQEVFSLSGNFSVPSVVVNPERPYLTKYERKWKSMGKDTYSVVATLVSALAFNSNQEVWDMEVEKHGGVVPHSLLMELQDKELSGEGYRAFFRDIYTGQDGTTLIRAIALDDGFEQHFFIRVIPSPRGVQAKMDSIGLPYRTPGTRACLAEVLKQIKQTNSLIEEKSSDEQSGDHGPREQ